MTAEEMGRLARWSARKRGLDTDTAENGTMRATAERSDAPAETAAEAEMLTEADLPDIDTLTKGSDFTAFLASNVPHHLHKLALRKLWRSDPVLANLDGLNDYDVDYTMSEALQAARESAIDLARGAKRLNAADRRAQDREDLRRSHAERQHRPQAMRRADAAPDTPDEPDMSDEADNRTDDRA